MVFPLLDLLWYQISVGILERHDSKLWIAGSETEIIRCVSVCQAKNCARHVANDAKNMSCIIVVEANLICTCTTGHDDVLFIIELGCINEGCWWLAGKCFGLFFFGWTCVAHTSSLCIHTWLVFVKVHIFIILLIIAFHLIFKIFALSCVILRNFWSIPINISEFFVFTKIPKLENIFLSIATCEQSSSISSKINSITAYVGAIPTRGWTLLPYIIDLNCVVPSSWCKYVWVVVIPFDAEDTIWMTTLQAAVFHFENDTFSMFVVDTYIFVFSCTCK